MADFQCDQAEGLRRLLERAGVRMMTLDSGCPGVGKTSAVINVAAALAARGSRVLVIDENHGPANVGGLLGVQPRFELQHVMREACTLEDALVPGPRGITLLGAANGARALPGLRPLDQERLIAGFGGLDGRFDVVLVDTPCAQADHRTGLFTHAVQDTIIVSSLAAHAITAAYALIKRLRAGPARAPLLPVAQPRRLRAQRARRHRQPDDRGAGLSRHAARMPGLRAERWQFAPGGVRLQAGRRGLSGGARGGRIPAHCRIDRGLAA